MSNFQAALDAAKELCVEGETEAEHIAHKEQLEAAYRAFAGQSEPSNPAPEGETQLSAHVVVQADQLS